MDTVRKIKASVPSGTLKFSSKGIDMILRKLRELAAKYRIEVTRVMAVFLLFIILLSEHSWQSGHIIDAVAELGGLILIVACIIGRTWSFLYICGYKNNTLVTEGPYSIVRNPLYFFSFMGGIGIGLASENLLVLAVITILFVFYYPMVVLTEEESLRARYGELFDEYALRTPRFIPKLSLLKEPDVYAVRAELFRKSLLSASIFALVFVLLQAVERLHEWGILPVFMRIP